ncbi:hypothetical protein Tcan_17006 [Toxocara canis]|uniref:Uncharacterized protein n=1 Tax=Toxocara canis TaxID=6265 RepID=A0A0B2UVR9_TOXCA|nr:hypothetical protein Tcan_17006 [Toxocara canis]
MMAAWNNVNNGGFGGSGVAGNWNGPTTGPDKSFNNNLNAGGNFNYNNNSDLNMALNNFNNTMNAYTNNMNNLINSMNAVNAAHRENMANAFNRINQARSRNEMEQIIMEMNANTQQALSAINNLNDNVTNTAFANAFNPNNMQNCQWSSSFNKDVSYSFRNANNVAGNCCNDPCCNRNCNNCWNCNNCFNCPGPTRGSFSVSQSGFSGSNPAQNWSETVYSVRLPNGQFYQGTINK